MFNSQNVGRCIQHFLYCSFVLSLPLFSMHVARTHNRDALLRKTWPKIVCWKCVLVFRHIFPDKILPPPYRFDWNKRPTEIFTQMLKFSSNFCIKFMLLETIRRYDYSSFHFVSHSFVAWYFPVANAFIVTKIGVAFTTWVSPLSSTLLIHNK